MMIEQILISFLFRGHQDKGHRGGLNDISERNWDGHICTNTKSSSYCPVTTIKMYLARCPPLDEKHQDYPFYLTPKTKIKNKDSIWFLPNQRVGKNQFNKYIARVCVSAGISGRYTVHSCRRTVVTWLYEDGWDPTAIMTITRHKSIGGVRAYTENTLIHQQQVSTSIDIYTPPEQQKKKKKKNRN
jgi:integrase